MPTGHRILLAILDSSTEIRLLHREFKSRICEKSHRGLRSFYRAQIFAFDHIVINFYIEVWAKNDQKWAGKNGQKWTFKILLFDQKWPKIDCRSTIGPFWGLFLVPSIFWPKIGRKSQVRGSPLKSIFRFLTIHCHFTFDFRGDFLEGMIVNRGINMALFRISGDSDHLGPRGLCLGCADLAIMTEGYDP